jgi:hypothetical protein
VSNDNPYSEAVFPKETFEIVEELVEELVEEQIAHQLGEEVTSEEGVTVEKTDEEFTVEADLTFDKEVYENSQVHEEENGSPHFITTSQTHSNFVK